MLNDGKYIQYGFSSYNIDERLQRVLGHCRIYFQEVALPYCYGLRFGKYGSFLPDCQHSPSNSPFQTNSQHILSSSISKCPQAVPLDNHGITSHRGFNLLPRRNGPESTTITSRAEGNSSRHDVSRKGSVTCSADQSNHAVPSKRIKLDRETHTTIKNKKLYQSLGLDMSSSSSEGDSPVREHSLKGSELVQTSSRSNNIKSSRDICHRWDSAETKNPVCPKSPVEHFSPEPRGMPRSLMEMGKITNKDTKYRSASDIEKMVTQKGIPHDSDDPKSCILKSMRYNEEPKDFPAYMRQSRELDNSNCSRGSYDEKFGKFDLNMDEETRKDYQGNDGLRSNTYRQKTSCQDRKLYSQKERPARNEAHRDQTAATRGKPKYSSHRGSQSDTACPKRRGKSVPRLDDSCGSHLRSKSIRPIHNQYPPKISKSSQEIFDRCNDMTPPSPVGLQKLTDEANKQIREANDLKQSANILKSSGLRIESTELFFQAALKYLDAASLLETQVLGSSKNVELIPLKIYAATIKLLEYCAQEFVRCKEMGCAALAYKCLEALNMWIVHSTDNFARRDCQELQLTLQSLTSGTTQVTNASNGNIKNQKYMETPDVPKDSTYSQPADGYPLDSRSRSMIVKLLNYTQYANSAMEASKKSQITFGYASKNLEKTGSTEIVDCIKRALNYGFYDMKKLLYLVYEAIEALSSCNSIGI